MDHPILDRMETPRDLRRLSSVETRELAAEVRDLIVKTTSVTGGHLASSLGAVELAIALLRTLEPPHDRVIWDVGHQAYPYKILTGRRERFHTLRQYGGISGFPRRSESVYDVVDSGHSGGSIAHGLGLALARDMLGEDYRVAVVIGDGSLTTGVSLEAMNQAGHRLGSNFIIILNDNEMSIAKNVGGLSSYLSRIRIKPSYTHLKQTLEEILRGLPKIGDEILQLASAAKEAVTHSLVPGMLFESMGLKYVGPIDGHDMPLLEETFREASQMESPLLIHVVTKKGKGYQFAERSPDRFHGVSAFDPKTGVPVKKESPPSYTEIFGAAMVELAREQPELVAITAAMQTGTGLDRFARMFEGRIIDVGIAEQLGVNLAAGLALGGLKPVVAIYSTFLQRAFDQISQEVCLQGLPVVFAVDRAGLVGEDGATHHGYFDLSYMRVMPGMTVMAPAVAGELTSMLRFALSLDSPAAVRFPRAPAAMLEGVGGSPIEMGRGEVLREGGDVTLLAIGDMVPVALDAAGLLAEKGVSATVVNARFAKPIDEVFMSEACAGRRLVVTLEDNSVLGGFGCAVLEALRAADHGGEVMIRGLPDRYVQHGSIRQLMEEVGLTADQIAGEVVAELGGLA